MGATPLIWVNLQWRQAGTLQASLADSMSRFYIQQHPMTATQQCEKI